MSVSENQKMDGYSGIKFETVDEYISFVPENARIKLEAIRKITKGILPEVIELISYNMPAYKFHGMLLYFAAHKEHIGFYPGNTLAIQVFKHELTGYNTSKGTIQFPINKDLPLRLIENIIKFRVKQNLDRAAVRSSRKK